MIFPSDMGFTPRSDFWIAFSISPVAEVSQGWMVMVLLSGAEIVATWLRGVGCP